MIGDRDTYVREIAMPDFARAGTINQHGNPFAGVIRAVPSRIIAMVCGDQGDIAVPQGFKKVR